MAKISRNNSNFESIDDVEVSSGVVPNYKVPEDKEQSDRLGFPLIQVQPAQGDKPKKEIVVIIPVERFKYYDGEKHHKFVAPTDKDLYKQCVEYCGESEKRFVTIVVKYNTNKSGGIVAQNAELMGIMFTPTQMVNLKKISKVTALSKYDIMLSSDNPEFHAKQMTAGKASFWRGKKGLIKQTEIDEDSEESGESNKWTSKQVLDEAWTMAENGLIKLVANELTDYQIKTLLCLEDSADSIEEIGDGDIDINDDGLEELEDNLTTNSDNGAKDAVDDLEELVEE